VGQCPTWWSPCPTYVAPPSVQLRKDWLTPTTWLPCSNAAKTRKPLKLAGVPQTTGLISTAGRPKFTILWGHLEEILQLNRLFPIFDTCLSCEDISWQTCTMECRWRFFASCIFSEPHAARFRPASQICTKATPCVEVWHTSNLRPLRLGKEKKKEKKPQGKNIMVCPIP